MTVPGTSFKKELNMGEVQTGCISVQLYCSGDHLCSEAVQMSRVKTGGTSLAFLSVYRKYTPAAP